MLCEGVSPSKLLCKWIHLHCYVKELIYTAVWSTQSTFCVKESLYTEKSIHTPVWRNQSTLLCAWILLHWGVPLHCCVKRSIYTACLIAGLVVCYSVVALTLPQACGSGLYSADLEPPHCRSPGMILSPRICQHTVRGKKNLIKPGKCHPCSHWWLFPRVRGFWENVWH